MLRPWMNRLAAIASPISCVAVIGWGLTLSGAGGEATTNGLLARPANSAVFPPDSHPYGMSYAEWEAAFAKWGMEYPVEGHPFANPDFDITQRQSGKVWFFGGEGTIDRTVTIPHGVALFFPLRDAEVSTIEDPPFFGATEAEQRAGAEWFADHIVDVFASVDGDAVRDLEDYRVTSPQYEFDAPTPSIVGPRGGPGTSVASGYVLMVKPLPVGTHTLHFGGTFHFDAGELGNDEPFDLTNDITLHVKVVHVGR